MQRFGSGVWPTIWEVGTGYGNAYTKGDKYYFFIPREKVPKNRKVSYVKPVAIIRPNKAKVNRVQLTARGDKLDYPGITATDVASFSTTKIHLNNVISTPKAK